MGYAEVVDEPLGVEDVERDLLEPKTAAVVFAGFEVVVVVVVATSSSSSLFPYTLQKNWLIVRTRTEKKKKMRGVMWVSAEALHDILG